MTLTRIYICYFRFHFWQSKMFPLNSHSNDIELVSVHLGHSIGFKQEAYFGLLCFNPSLRLTENLSFWQFFQFLAVSALSADLALREPDYRRKSLVPTPLLCRINSLAQRLRTCGNPTFTLLRSKVRKDPSTARPRWHHSSSHFPIGTLKTKQSKMLQKTSSNLPAKRRVSLFLNMTSLCAEEIWNSGMIVTQFWGYQVMGGQIIWLKVSYWLPYIWSSYIFKI